MFLRPQQYRSYWIQKSFYTSTTIWSRDFCKNNFWKSRRGKIFTMHNSTQLPNLFLFRGSNQALVQSTSLTLSQIKMSGDISRYPLPVGFTSLLILSLGIVLVGNNFIWIFRVFQIPTYFIYLGERIGSKLERIWLWLWKSFQYAVISVR